MAELVAAFLGGVFVAGVPSIAWAVVVERRLSRLTATLDGLSKDVAKLVTKREEQLPKCAEHESRMADFERRLQRVENRVEAA